MCSGGLKEVNCFPYDDKYEGAAQGRKNILRADSLRVALQPENLQFSFLNYSPLSPREGNALVIDPLMAFAH